MWKKNDKKVRKRVVEKWWNTVKRTKLSPWGSRAVLATGLGACLQWKILGSARNWDTFRQFWNTRRVKMVPKQREQELDSGTWLEGKRETGPLKKSIGAGWFLQAGWRIFPTITGPGDSDDRDNRNLPLAVSNLSWAREWIVTGQTSGEVRVA